MSKDRKRWLANKSIGRKLLLFLSIGTAFLAIAWIVVLETIVIYDIETHPLRQVDSEKTAVSYTVTQLFNVGRHEIDMVMELTFEDGTIQRNEFTFPQMILGETSEHEAVFSHNGRKIEDVNLTIRKSRLRTQ